MQILHCKTILPHKYCQAHVRQTALEFLGRESRNMPLGPGPSPAEKAGAKRGVIGPDPDNPRLDLSGKGMRSPWNRQVAELFGKWYVKLEDARTSDARLAEETFLSHVPALCKQAQGKQPSTPENYLNVVFNRRRVRRRVVCSTNPCNVCDC